MSTPADHSQSSPSARIDEICRKFSEDWGRFPCPVIEEYLPKQSSEPDSAFAHALLVQLIALDLEKRWQLPATEKEAGGVICRLRLADYAAGFPELFGSNGPPEELVCQEYYVRRRWGDNPDQQEYLEAYGQQHPGLRERLEEEDRELDALAAQLDATSPDSEQKQMPAGPSEPEKLPDSIGRYRIERVLGRGGFGYVYLGYDPSLERRVAVKVPHAHLVSCPDDAKAYLDEARTVANLDHRHIVPVYDTGSTAECPCYIVSKYIEGTNLADRIKRNRPSPTEASALIATVAEALHYAHKRELVHRHVKPGNILISTEGQPFLVDFGLALRDQDVGKGPRFAGTPPYTSPEQARGEGHRVDGRSDIFSLGIVFYEMLTGRRPFPAADVDEVLHQIQTLDPKPPRQIEDGIPKELERICWKALSKPKGERYTTAGDFAEDLRGFLSHARVGSAGVSAPAETDTGSARVSDPAGIDDQRSPGTAPDSDSRPLRIVPKGLRSFDEHDADFFLELLPGPRDRDGLPDSIRFWKTRIEETDPDDAFPVGLIYGPSGCGKSSLVKAGLLPRLAPDVIAVYVEATAKETETRLLNRLRRRCPDLGGSLDLTAMLAALRRGQGTAAGKKVLIVLDQFEQWLHAKRNEQNTELVQALRQCDGSRVQCVVLVRDDFWLAVSRFLKELEVRLVEGQNSALVDLFDRDHARRVLAAFGRAFDHGALP